VTGFGFSQPESASSTSQSCDSAGGQQSEWQRLHAGHQLPRYYPPAISFSRVGDDRIHSAGTVGHLLIKIFKECHSSTKCRTLCLSLRCCNPSQRHLDFCGAPRHAFLPGTSTIAFLSAAFPSCGRARFVLPAIQDDTVNKWLISHSVVSCIKYNYMMSKM